jgi:predicted outer membrane repeat protein
MSARTRRYGWSICLVLALCWPVRVVSAQTCGVWSQAATTGPSARLNFATAYDSLRSRVVLFGGTVAGGVVGDTWEWNGTAWTQVSTTGPNPRASSAMAYDSDRHVIVLFGGQPAPGTFSGDTWEWNGSAWTFRSSVGLPSRAEHAMAYDTVRHETVLFGGQNGVRLGDTWGWNGTTWSLRSSGGPSARNGHAMAYDINRGVAVLFGGFDGADQGDTWEWGGTSWALRDTTGPGARDNLGLAYDPALHRTLLFGGFLAATVSRVNDLWEWDGQQWAQLSSGATARANHSADYDSTRNALVVFGGNNNSSQPLSDTWTYRNDSIVTQPIAQNVCYRTPATFNVGVSASSPTYQWQFNTQDLADGPGMSGSHTATLSIAAATLSRAGSYRVVVTTPCTTLVSQAASLDVHACSATVYVKSNGPVNGDGTSWANAIRELGDAVQLAGVTTPRPPVWVARGTYAVDGGTGNRMRTLSLSGTALYGGFVGTESQMVQRNWLANPTVITADLLNNNVPGSIESRSDDTNNLITITGPETVVDGFTLEYGWAVSPNVGGGVVDLQGYGGTFQNCVFTQNDANSGAAIYSAGTVQILGCTFLNNRVGASGGALWLDGYSVIIANSMFNGNFAYADGGAVSLSSPQATVVGCTLFGNWAQTGTGGALSLRDVGSVQLKGSVLWANGDASGTGVNSQLGQPFSGSLRYSIVQGWNGLGGATNSGNDPRFVDATGPYAYSTYGTVGTNLRLRAGSSAIDAGDGATLASFGIATDIDGNVRARDDTGSPDQGSGSVPMADRGCYEFQGTSCYPNCDNSILQPVLNVADFACFLQRYAAGDRWANCDNSTATPVLNVADLTCFLQKYTAGCP